MSKRVHLAEPCMPAVCGRAWTRTRGGGEQVEKKIAVISATGHPQKILKLTTLILILVPSVGITKTKTEPKQKKTPPKDKNKHTAYVKENLKAGSGAPRSKHANLYFLRVTEKPIKSFRLTSL